LSSEGNRFLNAHSRESKDRDGNDNDGNDDDGNDDDDDTVLAGMSTTTKETLFRLNGMRAVAPDRAGNNEETGGSDGVADSGGLGDDGRKGRADQHQFSSHNHHQQQSPNRASSPRAATTGVALKRDSSKKEADKSFAVLDVLGPSGSTNKHSGTNIKKKFEGSVLYVFFS
jgi:hypothetical protein